MSCFQANVQSFWRQFRILSDQLRTRLVDAVDVPVALRALRAALFPNNTLAPSSARTMTPTTHEQALDLRRRAAGALVDALPDRVCRIYFASDDREDWLAAMGCWLDLVGDPYLNKHLVIRIVELLVVRIMPELAEQGAEALLEERLKDL